MKRRANTWQKIGAVAALVLSIAGCQIAPSQHTVALGDSAQLELARYWPEAPVQQLHQITWSHPEHSSQTFLTSSYLHQQGMTVIGFSPLGQELWRAELTPHQTLAAQGIAPFDDARLARAIVADLQLQQWPQPLLQKQLRNATLVTTTTTRQVKSHHGNLLWQAQTTGRSTTIINYVGGYRLNIELLEQQVLTTYEQGNE